jgi:phosphatidylethanolamine/phosphatidyl-N-methylethanolamine N-methyltransferase
LLESFDVRFLKQFIFNPMTVGAVAPSSEALAQTMIEDLGLETAEAVLEYGPGDGVFTEFILRSLKRDAKFAVIELNEQFAERFKSKFPSVQLFQDSAANVRVICDRAGMRSVDCIISGLPWAAFPETLQMECLDEMMHVLKPGGRFVTFAYVHGLALARGKKFASLLPKYFTTVLKSEVVWMNLPPAFVYRCRR